MILQISKIRISNYFIDMLLFRFTRSAVINKLNIMSFAISCWQVNVIIDPREEGRLESICIQHDNPLANYKRIHMITEEEFTNCK